MKRNLLETLRKCKKKCLKIHLMKIQIHLTMSLKWRCILLLNAKWQWASFERTATSGSCSCDPSMAGRRIWKWSPRALEFLSWKVPDWGGPGVLLHGFRKQVRTGKVGHSWDLCREILRWYSVMLESCCLLKLLWWSQDSRTMRYQPRKSAGM